MSKYELRSQLESGVNNGNLPFWVSILLPFFFCCTGREGSLGETLVDNIEISCFSCHLVKTRGPHCAVTLSPWWTFDSHMAASPSCGNELFHMRRCSEQGDNQRGKNLKRNVIKHVPVCVAYMKCNPQLVIIHNIYSFIYLYTRAKSWSHV